MNFYAQDVPYDMYCKATATLKADSVYKLGKNYDPKVYVEECKCTDAESQRWSILSVSGDDEGFVETTWTGILYIWHKANWDKKNFVT